MYGLQRLKDDKRQYQGLLLETEGLLFLIEIPYKL